MKLLFAYRFCGLGGVETSILNKLEALRQHGIEGHVFFSEFYGSKGNLLADHPLVTVGPDKQKPRELLFKGYDAISVIDYPAFLDTLDELEIESKVIFESHASYPPALDYLYSKLNHPRISAIVVPSHFNSRIIEKSLSTSKTIAVIQNPIDRRIFRPRQLSSVEARFQQPHRGPVIIWVGRLEDEKNPREFIKISQGVLESRIDSQFLIIGDAFNHADYQDYKNALYRAIKEKWREHFTFYQGVPYHSMPELYSLAAETGGCLVSTSLYESAPMTFIEAMSCKCPVVSTDVGGVKELITNDVTGRLYSVGDTDSGIQAIVDLMSADKNYSRAKLVDRALTVISTKHSLESVGQRYKDLLDLVVKGVKKKPAQGRWQYDFVTEVKQSEDNLENTRWSGEQSQGCIGTSGMVSGLVSTIIPVYNRSVLLSEAVLSVLSQTYKMVELIIVDDGSTDETGEICDQLASENSAVKVLHIPHQGLPGLVREAGRLVAKGEYIQYLDSDDLLLPTKFATMVRALEENPQCDIAYCYTRRYRRGDSPTNVPIELTGKTFQTMLPAFLGRRYWLTPTPLFRRRLCDKAGPWSALPFWEDIEYDIRIATMNPQLYHCREFLTDVRDHEMGRLSTRDFYHDPQRLRYAVKAARRIYQHIKNYGIKSDDENLRFFFEDVSVIHNRCKELGLNEDAQLCAETMSDTTRADNQYSIGEFTARAVIEPQVVVLTARPGETLSSPVRVVNESTMTFRPGAFAFELSYHLLAVDGTMLQFSNPRTLFEPPLRSGQECIVDMFLRAPAAAGLYYVEIDIVWGPITWFKSKGNPTAIVKLVVGESVPSSKWWLQVCENNSAKLEMLTDQRETMRIAISKAVTSTPWHIQLNQDRLPVTLGQAYVVKFQGRADQPRHIGAAVSKGHPPWDGLGLYREVELSKEWQQFELDFVATADDENARVHFDVGGSDVPVEFSAVTLCQLPDRNPVHRPLLSYLARMQMDIGVKPLSYLWGRDRGLPVHRYYLEQFLTEFATDIRGHCLEFQDPQYTPRFGGVAVTKLEILHIDNTNPRATIVADLTKRNSLPNDQFDCIVCTHVLHVIFDVEVAVSEIFRILKPGGVFLVGVPLVSMYGPDYHEMWRFTPEGLKRLLERVFGTAHVTTHAFGNSLTAAGEIRGVVAHEFSRAELDTHDPRFAVEVCARAIKPDSK